MLSQTAEHALRALLYLAGRPEGAVVPVEEIATAIGAPRDYLAKTLNALGRAEMVSGTRGPGGGFRLRCDPEVLAVAEVIAPFDPPHSQKMCLLGGRVCDAGAPCVAHLRWEAVCERAMAPLHSTTLADLLTPERAAPGNSPLDVYPMSNTPIEER